MPIVIPTNMLMKIFATRDFQTRAEVEELAPAIFEIIDLDQDGKISHAEYREYWEAIFDVQRPFYAADEAKLADFEKIYAEYSEPASPNSADFFLAAADPENKGTLDLAMFVVGECAKLGINLDGTKKQVALQDFDFKTETREDGTTGIALCQPIPVDFNAFVINEPQLVRMWQAHGHTTVTAVKVAKKIQGGLSQDNRTATVVREDGSEEQVFIKGCIDKPGNAVQKNYVECIFYHSFATEELKKTLSSPDFIWGMYDPENGRYVIVMKLLEDVVGVDSIFDQVKLDDPDFPIDGDLQEIGGAGCTLDSVVLSQADQLAAMHAHFWNNQERLQRSKGQNMHASWMLGEGEDTFTSAHSSVKAMFKMMTDKTDSEIVTKYPEVLAVFEACIDKITWENYQARYPKENFTVLHGDFHSKQMVWNTKTQQPTLFDYEFVGFGPGVMDIAYFMLTSGPKIRKHYEQRFLERYHEKLIASGKVDAAAYPLEQLKKDYVAYFVPKALTITVVTNAFMPEFAYRTSPVMAEFIKEHGITPENVLPVHFQFS